MFSYLSFGKKEKFVVLRKGFSVFLYKYGTYVESLLDCKYSVKIQKIADYFLLMFSGAGILMSVILMRGL